MDNFGTRYFGWPALKNCQFIVKSFDVLFSKKTAEKVWTTELNNLEVTRFTNLKLH